MTNQIIKIYSKGKLIQSLDINSSQFHIAEQQAKELLSKNTEIDKAVICFEGSADVAIYQKQTFILSLPFYVVDNYGEATGLIKICRDIDETIKAIESYLIKVGNLDELGGKEAIELFVGESRDEICETWNFFDDEGDVRAITLLRTKKELNSKTEDFHKRSL